MFDGWSLTCGHNLGQGDYVAAWLEGAAQQPLRQVAWAVLSAACDKLHRCCSLEVCKIQGEPRCSYSSVLARHDCQWFELRLMCLALWSIVIVSSC
jgi:hypothetical protein